MKRAVWVCALCAVAFVAGCGKRDTLVYLKTLPELDTSSIEPYVTIDKTAVAEDKMYVTIDGTAKQDLGMMMELSVDRYLKGRLFDTVKSAITPIRAIKFDENAPRVTLDPDSPRPGPPASLFEPISEGTRVTIKIDATTTEGVVTKLVIKAGRMSPAIPMGGPPPEG